MKMTNGCENFFNIDVANFTSGDWGDEYFKFVYETGI
jgi:hypothetical protein